MRNSVVIVLSRSRLASIDGTPKHGAAPSRAPQTGARMVLEVFGQNLASPFF
jgi:hypothetical protein